jgi:hypothetical protein
MPGLDAQHDFLRARRQATLARLAARLRGLPDDVGMILPYEEVVAALGFVSERTVGSAVVALEAIVGTVDRGHEFDRSFRPTSGCARAGSTLPLPPAAGSRCRPSISSASARCSSGYDALAGSP